MKCGLAYSYGQYGREGAVARPRRLERGAAAHRLCVPRDELRLFPRTARRAPLHMGQDGAFGVSHEQRIEQGATRHVAARARL